MGTGDHSPLESSGKLLVAAGVPEGMRGDGTLMGEAVVVLEGRHRGNLRIFDREGRPIGSAIPSFSDKSLVYTFSDTAKRFVLTEPPSRPLIKSLRSPGAFKAADPSFKLTMTDRRELTLPRYSRGPIEQDAETIAKASSCSRSEFVGRASRWSGIKEWRVIDRSDAEVARITFLRQRNLRYALNATILLGLREDRVNYVVHTAPTAQDIERAAAIALVVIIDTTVVDFTHAGEKE